MHQQAQMWHGDSSVTGATCQPPAAPNLPIPDASFLSAPASVRQTAASAPDRGTGPDTGPSSPGHRTRGPALVAAHWDTGHESQHRCLLTRTPGTRPGSGAGPSGHWERPWGDRRILSGGCGTGQIGCHSGHQGCQRAVGLLLWWAKPLQGEMPTRVGDVTPVGDATPVTQLRVAPLSEAVTTAAPPTPCQLKLALPCLSRSHGAAGNRDRAWARPSTPGQGVPRDPQIPTRLTTSTEPPELWLFPRAHQ